ncbi:hypothetical protein BJV74DRAFT_857114 [Russula compacta]|nr:hypothetical protein BJV74DRAFT_857114 [Russula compacta]
MAREVELLGVTSAHFSVVFASALHLNLPSPVMPMTRSNNTKPKPHIKLDAESADPPRMQCGQAEDAGQLLANVVAPGHSLANGDDTSLPAITGTRKRGQKLTEMIINEPDEDPASKRAKSGKGEASQSSKKGKAVHRQKQAAMFVPRDPLPDQGCS